MSKGTSFKKMKAFKMGERARANGKRLTDNPYKNKIGKANEYKSWEKGWFHMHDAMKGKK